MRFERLLGSQLQLGGVRSGDIRVMDYILYHRNKLWLVHIYTYYLSQPIHVLYRCSGN